MRNYVGYAQNEDLDKAYGAMMQTAQFVTVGRTDGYLLKDVIPVAGDKTVGNWGVEIQFLTPGGETIEDEDYYWDGEGWKGVLDEKPIDDTVKIEPGQGVWIFGLMGETPVRLRTAGEVLQSDAQVLMDTGYGAVAVANPYPVSITLDNFIPLAKDKEGKWTSSAVPNWGIELQCLTPGGETIEDEDYYWDGSKWCYVATDLPVIEKPSFAPGKGVWVFGLMGETESYLRVAAPEY